MHVEKPKLPLDGERLDLDGLRHDPGKCPGGELDAHHVEAGGSHEIGRERHAVNELHYPHGVPRRKPGDIGALRGADEQWPSIMGLPGSDFCRLDPLSDQGRPGLFHGERFHVS